MGYENKNLNIRTFGNLCLRLYSMYSRPKRPSTNMSPLVLNIKFVETARLILNTVSLIRYARLGFSTRANWELLEA